MNVRATQRRRKKVQENVLIYLPKYLSKEIVAISEVTIQVVLTLENWGMEPFGGKGRCPICLLYHRTHCHRLINIGDI